MSTLRTCPGGDALVSLLYDDFEPGAVPSRDDLEAHVRACATCLSEFEALGGVRAQLAAWTAPDVALGFEVVRTGTRAPLGWRQTFAAWSDRSARALPAAAAAILVLGGAMALARLDIHYDQAGLTVRTGWGHAAAAPGPGTGDDTAALRQELASLRGEIARLVATQATVTAASVPVAGDPSAVADAGLDGHRGRWGDDLRSGRRRSCAASARRSTRASCASSRTCSCASAK